MKSVYIHGSYFGNNFGDVLLVDLFAKRIRGLGYQPIFPFASDFYFSQTGTDVGIINKEKVLAGIFCGGGYLGEPGSGKLKWSIRNYLRHDRAYRLFRKNNIPYAVVGTGCGPVSHHPFKTTVSNIIKNSEFVVLRDEMSKKYAETYSGREDVDVLADAVISMTKKDIPEENIINANSFFDENIPSDAHVVGIHLTNKFKEAGRFQSIVEAITKLSSEHTKLHFVFLSDGKSRSGRKLKQEIDSDLIAMQLPVQKYSFYKYSNHWNMVATLAKLDVVITSKLHVGVVSTAMGVNVISIPYHSKTIRYFEQLRVPERCLVTFNNSNEVYDHIVKFLKAKPISVPAEVVASSKLLFVRIKNFFEGLDT